MISKQRAWQLRQEMLGNCYGCGEPMDAESIGKYKRCSICRYKDRQRHVRKVNE